MKDEDAMRVALRVLAAFSEQHDPDQEDVKHFRVIGPGEVANLSIDQLACEVIHNGVKNLRHRKALGLAPLGRVEDWRPCSVGSAYPLLPVSVGSASLSEP
jgi:hypothetical protein